MPQCGQIPTSPTPLHWCSNHLSCCTVLSFGSYLHTGKSSIVIFAASILTTPSCDRIVAIAEDGKLGQVSTEMATDEIK